VNHREAQPDILRSPGHPALDRESALGSIPPISVAFLLFPDVTQLDLTGSAQLLSSNSARRAAPREAECPSSVYRDGAERRSGVEFQRIARLRFTFNTARRLSVRQCDPGTTP